MTYLLTWNPKKFVWKDFKAQCRKAKAHGYLEGNWSCGLTKSIESGSRFFFLIQGDGDRGIIGSGSTTTGTYQQAKWKGGGGGTANYVDVRWGVLVDPKIGDFIPTIELQKRLPIRHRWQPQASGTVIPADIAEKLSIWWRNVAGKELQG